MNDKVFLHYSQAELDRNYDQRGWIGVANAEQAIARYVARSEAVRRSLVQRRTVAYGSSADEVLDIFPTDAADAPTLIFIHGGAWRNFTKDDYSFVAEALVPDGIHVVVINFSKLPNKRLPDVIMQARQAVAWVWHHAREFGGAPDRLYLCGHSSGAHMSAMVLLTDWSALGLPQDTIKGATLISGSYDLRPILLSARASYIKLSAAEEDDLSPIRHVNRVPCPVLLPHAEHDTDEFQRHTREFSAALKNAGKPTDLLRLPGTNHFEIIEQLAQSTSSLYRAALAHVEETTGSRTR